MDIETLYFLLDSSDNAILCTDYGGKVIYGNEPALCLAQSMGMRVKNSRFEAWLSTDGKKEFKRILKLLNADTEKQLIFYTQLKNHRDTDQSFKIVAKNSVKQELVVLNIANQESLDDAQKLYHLLAENAYDINVMFEDDQLVYISPSVQDFLGYTSDEISSLDQWHNLIHPEDFSGYFGQLTKDARDKLNFNYYSYRQRHKNGRYYWFETKVRREFKKDESVVTIATSVDITQRKLAEMALENQKEFIEELFDTDPNLIFVRDGNGRMIYCNQAVTQLLGVSREEFLSQAVNMFPAANGQEKVYRDIETRVINNNEELLMEEQITDKDGIVNYFQTIKKPLKTKDGDVNLLNISTNINKIKYYERENQKSMKAREDFFSAMSHEIRTPLNAIIGMADLLVKRNPRKDQQKLLHTLNFSAKNLLGLINNILDFSKIEAGKIVVEKSNLNLEDLLKNIQLSLRSWAQNKGLTLELEIDSKLPQIVQGDSVKLSQILNNLISNALKFTEKGSVIISARLVEKSKNTYEIVFEVSDTGIGIEEDKVGDIFSPFLQAESSTSRKYGGTGLGLSIVKNLVELQGGEISVASKKGEGTVFTVILPFKEAEQGQPVQTLPISQIQNLKWQLRLKLLYVEDVSTNQILMDEMLGDWGITVEMANNGNEALEKIDDCVYDLVLMDIQMPGMDGFETTRKIRAKEGEYFANVPIIAMTASTSESMKHEIMRSGMQDIVLKPVNIDELRSKIVEYTSTIEEIPEQLNGFDDLLEEEDNNHAIRFDKTDHLFLGNVIRYQEFLKKALEEFSVNLELLEHAISKQDITTFRHISHRMKSILATFGIDELAAHLDEIKEKIQKGQLKLKEKKEISKGIRIHIDYIRDEMSNKLASLKWQ